MGTVKNQLALVCSEDLSVPSFQVIVINANMRCTTCRERVFQIMSKITGLIECMVDVRSRQVVIKGDVKFLWRPEQGKDKKITSDK